MIRAPSMKSVGYPWDPSLISWRCRGRPPSLSATHGRHNQRVSVHIRTGIASLISKAASQLATQTAGQPSSQPASQPANQAPILKTYNLSVSSGQLASQLATKAEC